MATAACGSDDSDSGGGSGSGSGASSSSGSGAEGLTRAQAVVEERKKPWTEYPDTGPAIDGSKVKGKTIWYIPIGAVIPVIQIEAQAVEAATKTLGMSYKTCDGKLTPATWTSCINQAVNADAAGIITDSIDPKAVGTAVAKAKGKKIPMVMANSLGEEDELVQRMDIGGDTSSPPVAMNWMISDSKGKAKILRSFVEGDENATEAAAKGLAELKKNCPDCTETSVTSTPSTVSRIPSAVSSALLKNPDITHGFPQFDFLAPNFVRGVQQSGKKVKTVSTNAVLSQLKQIKAGTGQVADVGGNRNYLGWAATDRLLRMMLGEPAPTKVTIPVRLFDKTNIDSIDLTPEAERSGEWYGAIDYQQQFQKLWGLN